MGYVSSQPEINPFFFTFANTWPTLTPKPLIFLSTLGKHCNGVPNGGSTCFLFKYLILNFLQTQEISVILPKSSKTNKLLEQRK